MDIKAMEPILDQGKNDNLLGSETFLLTRDKEGNVQSTTNIHPNDIIEILLHYILELVDDDELTCDILLSKVEDLTLEIGQRTNESFH